jgi:hypothetical protein
MAVGDLSDPDPPPTHSYTVCAALLRLACSTCKRC